MKEIPKTNIINAYNLKDCPLETLVDSLINDLAKGANDFHITRAVPNNYRLVVFQKLSDKQLRKKKIEQLKYELKKLENEN